ncbi:hypothetical protein Ocin01_05024 [Orchesella cincta]|uniref:SUEL-type lectin domain-containing protein n=1 Tax=Orchesella cincta TaxID=48709 RepID=A0A1D2N8P7_ORCCI|nr:hypothetical protein Ocin01_05024 [Orchesella cincta]
MYIEILFVACLLFHFIQTSLELNKTTWMDEQREEVQELATKRPMTQFEPTGRQFKPIQIVPNETPCMYQKYNYLNQLARELQTNAVDILKNATTSISNQDYYLYDPEDLCMIVQDDLVVDIYQFDCSPMDVCICGLHFGYVDPNIMQPDPKDNIKTYIGINGLDRKLVEDDGACVSGYKGHCTPDTTEVIEKLRCSHLYECVIDDTDSPILTNKQTKYEYGICLPKSPSVPSGDNMIVYETISGSSQTFIPTSRPLILVIILEKLVLANILRFRIQ